MAPGSRCTASRPPGRASRPTPRPGRRARPRTARAPSRRRRAACPLAFRPRAPSSRCAPTTPTPRRVCARPPPASSAAHSVLPLEAAAHSVPPASSASHGCRAVARLSRGRRARRAASRAIPDGAAMPPELLRPILYRRLLTARACAGEEPKELLESPRGTPLRGIPGAEGEGAGRWSTVRQPPARGRSCCQQRECTVGTQVGATVGRGGGWGGDPLPPTARSVPFACLMARAARRVPAGARGRARAARAGAWS